MAQVHDLNWIPSWFAQLDLKEQQTKKQAYEWFLQSPWPYAQAEWLYFPSELLGWVQDSFEDLDLSDQGMQSVPIVEAIEEYQNHLSYFSKTVGSNDNHEMKNKIIPHKFGFLAFLLLKHWNSLHLDQSFHSPLRYQYQGQSGLNLYQGSWVAQSNTQNIIIQDFTNLHSPLKGTHYAYHSYQLNPNSQLCLINLIHTDDLNHLFLEQTFDIQKNAELKHFNLFLSTPVMKNHLTVNLNGYQSKAILKGMYHLQKTDQLSIALIQNHNAQQCFSDSLYKGTLTDQSHGSFQGLIHVSPEAKETDAYLSNKNIILKAGAKIDSIPMLEIDNNDVKCSHSSSSSQLNREDLFYLQSRGLSAKQALTLLLESFFLDLIQQLPEAIQQELTELILKAIA